MQLIEKLIRARLTGEFIRFALVGVVNTGVSYLAYVILIEFGIGYQVSNVISYIIGMITSYILNKNWTFGIKERSRIRFLIRFVVVNIAALLVSLGIVSLMVEVMETNVYIGQLFAIAGHMVVNFAGQKFWVFR